ncbi:MAG TPA: SUMF1/EgtB/PvdO family nonheme iron enzyme [Kofleriaceae bacterium]|nr:SUMF1/EgtB/PvdO family nonheme iron enzyme [Kofleriaceae bacterium]
MKILFVAANTHIGDPLALDEEYRAIERSIRLARHRDAFQLIPQLAARRDDLQHALLEHAPDIVHFACHGTAQAELVLQGDGSGFESMPPEALASMFRVLRDNLKLIVFNACFAKEQAQAVRAHVGAAIGMAAPVEDRVAVAFASALYGALAYGRSVREAFDLGVAAVAAIAPDQQEVPQLLVSPGVDTNAIRLAGDRRASTPRIRRLVAAGAAATLALAWSAWPQGEMTGQSLPRYDRGAQVVRAGEGVDSPPSDMIRFAAVRAHPRAAARLAMCTSAADDDCSESSPSSGLNTFAPSAFDLDVLEVTNADYATWLAHNRSRWTVTSSGVVKTAGEPGVALVLVAEPCGGGLRIDADQRVVASPDKAAWPVVCVTWQGASEYCRAHRKRLPLEGEWDWAARGMDDRPFPWGADPPRHDGVAFDLRDGASPHPRNVGTSPQDVSPEGVRDLGGNVAEWVEDGRGALDHRTLRGGSWASRGPCNVLGSSCKRVAVGASGPYGPDVGFRCARSVIDDPHEEWRRR